ncbi:MAG: sodium-dependent transporter [Gemmatimonadota bacterium]
MEGDGGSSRGAWGSQLGFLLAAIGGAVGLGNMWRFSATASSSGGAAFVVVYIALTFLVGVPLLLAELAIGRRAAMSPIGALRRVAGRSWVPAGYMFVAGGFVIFSFYSVIAGWAVRYGVEALLSGLPVEPGQHFGNIATGPAAALYHVGFVALTALVVMGGVRAGIERAALILMPTLFLMLVGLAVWAATLAGAAEGYSFYLAPRFDELLNLKILGDAAAQTYFSLSLGMGAMLTFASYLGKNHDLGRESGIIAVADFSVAFAAGLVTFPIVFALGFSDQVIGLTADEAEGVLFIALPGAFALMGDLGRGIGVLFFAALSVAALTSTISLLEVLVSSVIDEMHVERKKATMAVGLGVALLGIAPAYSLRVLASMNEIAGGLLLGLGAFLITIAVGWFMHDPVAELADGAGPLTRKLLPGWYFLIRFVMPVITGFVFYSMIVSSLR